MKHLYRNGTSTWGSDILQNKDFEKALDKIVFQKGIILDIGCGKNKVAEHVIGVDPYADDPAVDVRADMWNLPYENESVDAVLTFHSLEHISKYQVLPALNEFRRVLKYGGWLVIVVPDLIKAMEKFIAAPSLEWTIDTIYGTQLHEGEFHKTGFTPKFLQNYLYEVGYRNSFSIFTLNAYHQDNIGLIIQKVKEKASG